jgi:maltose O-acetyltransferase
MRYGAFRMRRLVLYLYNHVIARFPIHTARLAAYRRLFPVGTNSTIMLGLKLRSLRNVRIGSFSNINPDCMLDGRGGTIAIGDYVDIAPEVQIWTLEHDPMDPAFGVKSAGVVIEDHAWIASRAILLPGVRVGKGGVVAAGAVVTRDVEPYTIVAGVPARPIGMRTMELQPKQRYNPFLL